MQAFLSLVEADLNLVNLFRGQAKNDCFGLEFTGYNINQPFNNANTTCIVHVIMEQIKLSMLSGCLFGPCRAPERLGRLGVEETLDLGRSFLGMYLCSVERAKHFPAALER